MVLRERGGEQGNDNVVMACNPRALHSHLILPKVQEGVMSPVVVQAGSELKSLGH